MDVPGSNVFCGLGNRCDQKPIFLAGIALDPAQKACTRIDFTREIIRKRVSWSPNGPCRRQPQNPLELENFLVLTDSVVVTA